MNMISNLLEIVPCRWHDQLFVERVHTVRDVGIQVFRSTRLVESGIVDQSDLEQSKEYFRRVTPDFLRYPTLANWNDRGGLVEHTDFAAAIAFCLAEAVNGTLGTDLNPLAHAAALKLHDLGRTTTHSFMETDVMTDHLWKMIGLRPDIHDLTHSAELYWKEDETPVEQLTIAQRISIIADTAGKRSSANPDRLRLTSEIIPSVKNGKKTYLSKPNPTFYERQLVEKLPQYSSREEKAISYTLAWFAGIGINLDAIIQAIPVDRLI